MSKILIVDDDPVVTTIYQDKFRSVGYETQAASSGRDAIAQIAKAVPDLIILDLVLGDISGVDVLKFIRGNKGSEQLPVIVLSNTYMGELIESAWAAGATKCFSKTATSPGRVADEIQKLIGKGRGKTAPPAPMPVPVVFAATSIRSTPSTTSPLVEDDRSTSDADLGSDPQAQSNMRRQLHHAVLQRIEEMNHRLEAWQADPSQDLAKVMGDVRRSNHALMGSAALGGWPRLAQLAGAFEALLSELEMAKIRMSASAMQTVRQTLEFLPRLLRDPASSKVELNESPLILVLDDDPISRKMLCALLKRVRLNALAVSDPALAVKLFEENRFDLIFCDVEMPGMNGFELGDKLRDTEANESTPIVYVTSHGDIKARDRSAKVGAVDFITKPVLSSELALKATLHLFRGSQLRVSE